MVELWEWNAKLGKTYRLDLLVSVCTSRDVADAGEAAARHLKRLHDAGVDALIKAHAESWKSRWQAVGVQVDGDEQAQGALRFATYHLIGTANPEDECTSIGARALTGPAYKGHAFWDTEIYMLPFYVFTQPPAARALLMYRHNTPSAARHKARDLGYRGALFAWESTDTGEEATPAFALAPDGEIVRIVSGEQEHHISAGITYAIWQYWQCTGEHRLFLMGSSRISSARAWLMAQR